jgi:hypothetical protein
MNWKTKLSNLFSSSKEPTSGKQTSVKRSQKLTLKRLQRLTLISPDNSLSDGDEMLSVIEEVAETWEKDLTRPPAPKADSSVFASFSRQGTCDHIEIKGVVGFARFCVERFGSVGIPAATNLSMIGFRGGEKPDCNSPICRPTALD